MFLGGFGRRVETPRVDRRVFVDQTGRQSPRTVRTGGLETSGFQVRVTQRAGSRRDAPVVGTVVPPFAVHDHGTGQQQPGHTRRCHGRQEDRRSQVVAGHVFGGVGEVTPHTDHRGLVTHEVHTGKRLLDGDPVPHVSGDDVGGHLSRRAVRRRQERVEHDDITSGTVQGVDYV